MAEVNQRTPGKWLGRVGAVAACAAVSVLAISHLGPFALFPIVGAVVVLVYVLDAPQAIFSIFAAARRKVQGIEHDGRHDWYGFRGTRMRLFFDETGKPWIAAKEITQVLEIRDVAEKFRSYGRAEFAAQPSASGEQCLSEAGLRRLLKYSQHRDAHALLLWFEREVMLPLQRRRELYPGAADRQ